MPRDLTTPRRRCPALLAACAAAALLLSGCGSEAPSAGPASVSVVKKQPAAPQGATSLERLQVVDAQRVPGASQVQLGSAVEDLWLPEASELTSALAGADETPEGTGSFYLQVPAEFDVTRDAIVESLGDTRPPGASVTDVTEPTGTVVTVPVKKKLYVLSVSSDTARGESYSTVLVQWTPRVP